MLTLDVEHANSTDTLRILGPDELGDADAPSMQSARIERKLARQPDAPDTAEVTVYRDAWSEVEQNLDRTNDRLVVREGGDIIFGGRLRDTQRSGVVVSVLIDGPKRDAIDAEPSGANDVYQPQDDSTLLTTEVLPRVPTVGAGTVETVEALAFSEAHASPGKSITKLARDAGAEVRYRATETGFELDYVSRLGSDRTGETLSPSSATVYGEPRVREQITENVTHVRVLGAGEGTAQVQAEAVAAGYDPADDRPVYRQRTDKDIQQSARAQTLAETLVAEYDGAPEYLEVEVELPRSVSPSLGDTFPVSLPAHDVDATLRITMLERLLDEAGDRFRAILSNRTQTGDTDGNQSAVELDSLSEGNPGQYYALADGEGYDPVDAGEPYEFTFYRPLNTIGELNATLRIESREYRLRASQVGHDHTVSISDFTSSASNSEFEQVVGSKTNQQLIDTPGGAWTTVDSFTPSADTSLLIGRLAYAGPSANATFSVRLYNQSTGTYFPDSGGHGLRQSAMSWQAVDPSNTNGETLHLQVNPDNSLSAPWSTVWTAIGRHDHDLSISDTSTTDSVAAVDPGINTISGQTPSGVDVTVAGQTVATGLDHPVSETIDIGGVLSDGRNDIEITSDSLGELRATLEYEAIKNADSR